MRTCWIFLTVIAASAVGFFLYSDNSGVCLARNCAFDVVACFDGSDEAQECRAGLSCLAECDDPTSNRSIEAKEKFSHLQRPEDPMVCAMLCLDAYASAPGSYMLPVITCAGESGCMRTNTGENWGDKCVDESIVRSMKNESFSLEQLAERKSWWKNRANSWDIWPCQRSEFYWNNQTDTWHQNVFYRIFAPERNQHVDVLVEEELFRADTATGNWLFDISPPNFNWSFITKLFMYGVHTEERWTIVDASDDFVYIYVCASTKLTDTTTRDDSIALVFSAYPTLPKHLAERANELTRRLGLKESGLIEMDNTKCDL